MNLIRMVWPRPQMILLVGLLGCSGAPSGISLPELDVAAAAKMAITDADKDGDGELSLSELAAYPALTSVLDSWDGDSSQKLSTEEIQTQLQKWRDQGTALSSVACKVLMNGRGLNGATVEFIPEPFMGSGIKPASGVTGQGGLVIPSLSKEHLPEDLQSFRGMHLGIYKVRVTHPKQNISSEFNTNTTLGVIVAPGTVEVVLRVKGSKKTGR